MPDSSYALRARTIIPRGNFPHAFTHVALIGAAYDLNRRLEAAGEGT
jgi:hypothetical protein